MFHHPDKMASLPQARHGVEAASLTFAAPISELPGAAVGALRKAGIDDCRFCAMIVEGEEDAKEVILDTVLGLCGPLDFEFDDGSSLLWDTLVNKLVWKHIINYEITLARQRWCTRVWMSCWKVRQFVWNWMSGHCRANAVGEMS